MKFGRFLVIAMACATGCTITESREYDENGQPVQRTTTVDSTRNASSDGGYNEYHDAPAHEERHEERREERHEERHETVVWYRELPDQGYLDSYLPQGMQGECHLDPGVYRLRGGKIKLRGGGLTIVGSGTGQTVIDGDVDVKGDNFVFRDFGITGSLYLRGANCQVHVYVEGFKDVSGPNLNARYQSRPVVNNPQPAPRPQPAPQPAPQPQPQPERVASDYGGSHLPHRGNLDQFLPKNFQGECFLEPGIYKLRGGKIKFGGGGLAIHGAGKDKTFIEGDMVFHGDGFVMDQLTVKGDVEVHGNNNTGDIVIRGHKDIRGGNNQGW